MEWEIVILAHRKYRQFVFAVAQLMYNKNNHGTEFLSVVLASL